MTRSRRLLGFTAVAAVVLYILFFPASVPPEYLVHRDWVRAIGDAPTVASADTLPIPFRLNGYFGYIADTGQLIHVEQVRHGVAFTSGLYSNYGNVVQNLVLQDPTGRIVSSLGPSGYPVFVGGRLFTLDGAGSSLSEWDPSSDRIWQRHFPSIITALRVAGDTVAVGLLSGRILLLDGAGNIMETLRPGQSAIESIYGLDLDGGILAAVSGKDPQLLTFYEGTAEGWIQTAVRELDTSFIRSVFVAVAGSAVYFETHNGVAVATAPDWTLKKLPVRGTLVHGAVPVGPELLAFLTRDEGSARLSIVNFEGALLMESRFVADSVWMTGRDGALYLGIDDTILRLEVRRA